MSGTVWFGEENLTSLGLRIGGVRSYQAPGGNNGLVLVPGRLGEAIMDPSQVDVPNEIREYDAALYMRARSMQDVSRKMADLRQVLIHQDAYMELTDSYEPDFYRRAVWTGDFTPERAGAGQNFKIPLRFSCDPRRFVAGVTPTIMAVGGASYVDMDATGIALNMGLDVRERAKPVIVVTIKNQSDMTLTFYASGSPSQHGEIKFSLNGGAGNTKIYFFADTLSASYDSLGKTNANIFIEDVTGEIDLRPTGTRITRSNTNQLVEIVPRWYVR